VQDHLLDAVRTFTGAMRDSFDRDHLLHRLIDQTMVTLGAQGAGIMLDDGRGHLGYAASSGERVGKVEMVQEQVGTGACYEAYTTNTVIAVADLELEARWPEYVQRTRRLGFGAVIGAPLHAWGQTVGVLNVYRERPGKWTPDEVDACEMLAALGAGYILIASQMEAQHDLADQLQAALDSRGVIERAKGILMQRDAIDTTAAFESLRKTSMDTNRKLREVAQQIVENTEDTTRT
jgi:GAF domain-containing protein